MEEIIAEGIGLIEITAKCIVNDGSLDLKGRKLGALETEEIEPIFKPRKEGKSVFKEKIQHMNEAREYKSCELEQVTIIVKQPGIRGG